MSVELMGAVFYLALPPGPKYLLLALADNANESGHAWPSQELLAVKVSADSRTVRRQTRLLEEEGWLEVTGEPSRGHGLHYFLNAERIKADAAARKADIQKRRTLVQEKADTGDTKADIASPRTTMEPPREPSSVTPNGVTAYTSKGDARKNKNDAEDGALEEPQDTRVWPEWYAHLYAIPGFHVPLNWAEAWNEKQGITLERATDTASALHAKWGGPRWKYTNPWATYQTWVKRPPVQAPGPPAGAAQRAGQTMEEKFQRENREREEWAEKRRKMEGKRGQTLPGLPGAASPQREHVPPVR